MTDYDPAKSDHYHQACLARLIPILDDAAAVLDENLLASIVILRYLEEIECEMMSFAYEVNSLTLLQCHSRFTTATMPRAT